MILSNTEEVPGRAIREFYGVVTGSTVRSKHFGKDLLAGLKNLVGGELKGYTELLHEARQEAIDFAFRYAVVPAFRTRRTHAPAVDPSLELF